MELSSSVLLKLSDKMDYRIVNKLKPRDCFVNYNTRSEYFRKCDIIHKHDEVGCMFINPIYSSYEERFNTFQNEKFEAGRWFIDDIVHTLSSAGYYLCRVTGTIHCYSCGHGLNHGWGSETTTKPYIEHKQYSARLITRLERSTRYRGCSLPKLKCRFIHSKEREIEIWRRTQPVESYSDEDFKKC